MKRYWKKTRWPIAILIALFVFDYWTFPLLSKSPEGCFDQGRNGIWMRYPWYFGEHTDGEVQQMASRLCEDGFAYAYFHARDVRPDGSLRYPHWAEAKRLNRTIAQAGPALKRVAWIYVGNSRGRGAVDLLNEEVRTKLVSEARRLVVECGFQGIQWDYEICGDGERGMLRLLEDSRKALPPATWLGAAVPTWYPWPLSSVGWSESYFRAVADRCDQIAVMAYDSAAYSPRLYSWFVAQQVAIVGRAVKGSRCRYVIGVPTYEDGTRSHNPRAECLTIALRAVKSALAEKSIPRFEGVAIFADYTTDSTEWRTYRNLWRR